MTDNKENNDNDYDENHNHKGDKKILEFLKKEYEGVSNHPLIIQFEEIRETLDALLNNSESLDDFQKTNIKLLKNTTTVLLSNLYEALKATDYLTCIQYASDVRHHAEYLRLSSNTLNEFNVFDKSYVSVFRDEMEKFRILFINWIKKIKQMDRNGIEDEWGVF